VFIKGHTNVDTTMYAICCVQKSKSGHTTDLAEHRMTREQDIVNELE